MVNCALGFIYHITGRLNTFSTWLNNSTFSEMSHFSKLLNPIISHLFYSCSGLQWDLHHIRSHISTERTWSSLNIYRCLWLNLWDETVAKCHCGSIRLNTWNGWKFLFRIYHLSSHLHIQPNSYSQLVEEICIVPLNTK